MPMDGVMHWMRVSQMEMSTGQLSARGQVKYEVRDDSLR